MNDTTHFSKAFNFEAFVRYIADSQEFVASNDKLSKLVGKYSDWIGAELSEDELDMVAAAAKIPIPEFKNKKI